MLEQQTDRGTALAKKPPRNQKNPPRRLYHNKAPDEPSPGSPKDVSKLQFARKLQHLAAEKGWNQSEIARQAALHMASGVFARDNVSNYIRGIVTPSNVHLRALADAFGVTTDDLLKNAPGAERNMLNPPFEFRDMGDGLVWLKVNQAVDFQTAMAIAKLVKGEK